MSGQSKSGGAIDIPASPAMFPSHSYQSIAAAPGQQDRPVSHGIGELDVIKTPKYRFLSPAEWEILSHGIGGAKDAERRIPVHPSHFLWPPKGMPRGLYKDVVFHRVKSLYLFHAASVARWSLVILQLLIGATLTGLSHLSPGARRAVTFLSAVNTVIAGLLAILHNTGMPDRYRHDMNEFEALEDHLMKLLDTGIVPADVAVEQVIAECYEMYHNAKATVAANMPASYVPGQALQATRQSAASATLGTWTPPKMP